MSKPLNRKRKNADLLVIGNGAAVVETKRQHKQASQLQPHLNKNKLKTIEYQLDIYCKLNAFYRQKMAVKSG